MQIYLVELGALHGMSLDTDDSLSPVPCLVEQNTTISKLFALSSGIRETRPPQPASHCLCTNRPLSCTEDTGLNNLLKSNPQPFNSLLPFPSPHNGVLTLQNMHVIGSHIAYLVLEILCKMSENPSMDLERALYPGI